MALHRFFNLLSLAALLLGLAVVPVRAQSGADDLRVTLGKSLVIDYPEDVTRISTSAPEVVDYVPVSAREILLHAKGVGTATVVIWAKSGQRNFYNVNVELNMEPVRKMVRDAYPNEEVRLTAARDTVTATGTVSSQSVADRIAAMVTPTGKTFVNNMRVKTAPVEKQILLRVKFAQLDRTYGNQFGVNLVSTGALNTVGGTGTGQFASARMNSLGTGASNVSISDTLNLFAFRPDLNLAGFIKALQNQGVLQILAEPNLVTTNGKEATFLVGGEFPVPVLQGGSNAGAVTVQFREFGIRLTFNPSLTENGTLKMYVKPEVSTIDLAHGVTVSGFTIPALATRRVESNVELGLGQSFVIGGLIDDRTDETMSKMPGLSAIPLLGQLFKSRNENRSKTELLVMVTPELVEPMTAGDPKLMPQLPGEFLRPMMLPDGLPGSSNVGSGAPAIKAPAVKTRKDAFKSIAPPASR